ncbi:MAG: extracellular solute-binding protein [Chloroflexi bacterium]|nr:extracellular solute-binding protein [Chloroflexota bacterium]
MKLITLFVAMIAVFTVAWLVACTPPAAPAPTAAPAAPAASGGSGPAGEAWRQQWENIVAGARKEGTVAVTSAWGPQTRNEVIKAVKEKYGINVEITSAPGSALGERILSERRAGIYSYDVAVQGTNFGVNLMKPNGVYDPVEPVLILPEVKDPKAWLGGEFPRFDRARTMIPFLARLDTNLSINTDQVKSGEITAYKDLLAPKWKGKIVLKDPTKIGTGSGWFRENGKDLGLDFMRALAKQEPALTINDRQLVEWLARGKYSALIAGSSDELFYFIKEGAPISILDAADSRILSPSSGMVSIINRAPHPNAAALFANWILTKEGQTVMTRTIGLLSRRLDAPTDHILPVLIPNPGRKYTEYTEEGVAGDAEALAAAREIFGPLLEK